MKFQMAVVVAAVVVLLAVVVVVVLAQLKRVHGMSIGMRAIADVK